METVKLNVLVDGCEPQKTGGNKSDWVDLTELETVEREDTK